MYYFILALIDFFYNKNKNENLGKYISSLLYLAYDMEIISEEFFCKYASTNMSYNPSTRSSLITSDFQNYEEKFLTDSAEFANWLR